MKQNLQEFPYCFVRSFLLSLLSQKEALAAAALSKLQPGPISLTA